jgi:2-oxo-4-hydroxy-4-carboxy-5-ureidoimidazoline decarboxylase
VDPGGLEDELNAPPITLDTLNALDCPAFTAALGGIFEHSPWVAKAAYVARPFGSIAALHATMVSVVMNAGAERQLTLLRAHPELASRAALTEASTAEQGGMGLDRLAADEAATFAALNGKYRARFGFPFIIAVRGQRDRTAMLAALSSRCRHDPELEIRTSLTEVAKIARFRLDDLIRARADV